MEVTVLQSKSNFCNRCELTVVCQVNASGKSWTGNNTDPDSKIHGANMGPTWVLSAPDGPHVGPMNLAIRDLCYLGIYHDNQIAALKLTAFNASNDDKPVNMMTLVFPHQCLPGYICIMYILCLVLPPHYDKRGCITKGHSNRENLSSHYLVSSGDSQSL